MGLRKKTLIIIVSVFLVLTASVILSSRFLVLKGFIDLEKEDTQLEVEHVWAEISNDISRIDSVAGDWAPWDDTYEFIHDRNQEYIESNLSADTLLNLKINFMMFVNRAGQLIFEKSVDFNEGGVATLPVGLWTHINSKKTLFEHASSKEGTSGILMFGDLPVLIAARPIVQSNFQGPYRGTLIAGKYLDASEIEKISETAHLSVSIQPFNRPKMPSDFKKALSLMSEKDLIAVNPLNKNFISGYMVRRDIEKNPAFILKIETRRNIYNQGLNTLLYFNVSAFAIGLIFILSTILLMEKSVLSPLIVLIQKIENIGENGGVSKRIDVSNKTELGKLELSINRMLDRIQAAQDEIKTLEGLIPICSHCKNIRNDNGFWQKVDSYLQDHTHAQFSHGICPDCAKKHYPDLDLYEEDED
jgi:sensor domain CHASE-containing protein